MAWRLTSMQWGRNPGKLSRLSSPASLRYEGLYPISPMLPSSPLSYQGVRDEKMMEKLAMHDVETVTTLFALADKCARAAEGHAWHSTPQTGVA
jgi:hypothetical protein